MKEYNILSIDGGGMKALIAAIVIEALEHEIQHLSHNQNAHIADYFDLLAGTSAGSILAGIYLCPDSSGNLKYRASDAVDLMKDHGSQIFSNSLCYRIRSLYGLRSSKYQNSKIERILDKYFGEVCLDTLSKPCMIPAYDLMHDQPFFFNSISAQKNNDVNFLLRDAVLASCSAPTYFPPVQISSVTGKSYTMVDGGLASNNPALCAFVEAMKMPRFDSYKNVNIFSVGNVSHVLGYPYAESKNWGLIEWALPLLDIFLSSNTTVVDYEMRMLYQSFENNTKYTRIEKIVHNKEESPSLDDASEKAIKKLTAIGNQLVDEHAQTIHDFAVKLLSSNNNGI